ncbi:MAG TPA: GTPase Era, partial [Vicinamibacteria bacterium]
MSRAGFVAVMGRPNVGKSTLVNQMVGQKVAIVSNKPQTTRNRILAVLNPPGGQIVLFDTPGLHKPTHAMNRRMVDLAQKSLGQVDLALWVLDAREGYTPAERHVRDLLGKTRLPVILVINKIDALPKLQVLPLIDRCRSLLDFADIVPVSAKTGDNVDRLIEVVLGHLPEGPPLYPEEFLTDQPERFFVAEIVREKVLARTRDEIPYSAGVLIDSFKEERGMVRIEASLFVERDGQKAIVIGKGGEMLKAIGTDARLEIEEFLGSKVFLGLFVK